MLKYLRDKLFFDLGPTATTDLSRPFLRDMRHVARHMSRVVHHYTELIFIIKLKI